MSSVDEIRRLLNECTVRVDSKQPGTGFFVSEKLVLTCRHVVQENESGKVSVHYKGLDYAAHFQLPTDEDLDLSLITIDNPPQDHPSVWFSSELSHSAHAYAYGYPQGKEDGDPSEFKYEGTSGNSTVKLKKGQADFGFSGSPVLNQQTLGVFGVIYMSRDVNSALGARVIPVEQALSAWNELSGLNTSFHEKNRCWVRFLPVSRWLEEEQTIREQIVRRELSGHSFTVDSPLQQLWNQFTMNQPWHEGVRAKLQELSDSCSNIADTQFACKLIAKVDCDSKYDFVVSELRTLLDSDLTKVVNRLMRSLEERNRDTRVRGRRQEEEDKHIEFVNKRLGALRRIVSNPNFEKCFLVLGSLGAGKTHFIAHQLSRKNTEGGSRPLILLIQGQGSEANISIEKLLLTRISEITRTEWNSLADFDHYLAVNGRALIIAIDDFDRLVQREETFATGLKEFIQAHTHLHGFSYLLTADLHNYDLFADRSEFWREFGITDLEKTDIGGWLPLHDRNREEEIGISIIESKLGPSDTGLVDELRKESPGTLAHLTIPMIAWALLDIRGKITIKRLVNLAFIEFVEQFWETWLKKLAPSASQELAIKQCAQYVAQVFFELDAAPSRVFLIKSITDAAKDISELGQFNVAQKTLAALIRGNLLDMFALAGEALTPVETIVPRFELFWEWIAARSLLANDAFRMHDRRQAANVLADRYLKGRGKTISAEGVLEFLLLLVDRWTRKGKDDAAFAQEIWLSVAKNVEIAKSVIFFSGPKASSSTQASVVRWVSQERPNFTTRKDIFSFLHFCSEAGVEAFPIAERFRLLQPRFEEIAGAQLQEFFRYLASRLFDAIDSGGSLVVPMTRLSGCEVLDLTSDLAGMAIGRMIGLSHTTGALDYVLDYMRRLSLNESGTKHSSKLWERFFFHEWALCHFCSEIVAELGTDAYSVLASGQWYFPSKVGISNPLGISMVREANLAFGYWFRSPSRRKDERQRYYSLVESLMNSSNRRDHETAFYLIRHTEKLTETRKSVRVDPIFQPLIQRLATDGALTKLAAKYSDFFRSNLRQP